MQFVPLKKRNPSYDTDSYGTPFVDYTSYPALETPGYFQPSLWDAIG
jgi:hypothetical protein